MGSITIRKLDDQVKLKLRVRAAQHGRSMEEEAREILSEATVDVGKKSALAPFLAIRERMAELGIKGVKLPKYKRGPMRKPPTFD
jgi:plasmid stability protein